MRTWMRRVRGAVLTGLTWAVTWGPVAVLVSLVVDPRGAMDEPWVLIGAIPGFVGGVAFATVLGVAARRRRLRELSIPRVAAWGAAAGLLVGVTLFVVGEPTTAVPLWLLRTVVIAPITLLSAGSAAASLAIARRAERHATLAAGADVAGAELTEGD